MVRQGCGVRSGAKFFIGRGDTYAWLSGNGPHGRFKRTAGLACKIRCLQAKGLKLDMSRGKPEAAQLDLSMGSFCSVRITPDDTGVDTRTTVL